MRAIILLLALLLGLAINASAVPTTYHLLCSQGEDCRRVLVFKAAGLPVNLTGYQFAAQVRASVTDAHVLGEFLIDPSDMARGKLVITLPAAVTSQLAGRQGAWDLRQTDPSGSVTYLLRGNFLCSYSATR